MYVVADVLTGLACPLSVISDPRLGSVATETRYFRAPATGAQLSRSGVAGYVICAPPSGERRVVLDAQAFLIERPRDQHHQARRHATAYKVLAVLSLIALILQSSLLMISLFEPPLAAASTKNPTASNTTAPGWYGSLPCAPAILPEPGKSAIAILRSADP